MRDDKPTHRWLRTPRQAAVDQFALMLVTILSVAMIAVVSWFGPAEAASRIVGAFQ